MVAVAGREVDQKAAQPPRKEVLIGALSALLILALLGPLMTTNEIQLSGEGNAARQLPYVIIFGFVVFAVRPIQDPKRLLAVPIPILVALGWCWLSLIWAIEPSIAIRRLILTTLIIWSIFVAVRYMRYDYTTTAVRIILVCILVANYIAVFGFPEIGIHQFNYSEDKKLIGDWAGVLVHKNIAGAVCAITMLVFLFDSDNINKYLKIGVIVAAACFLFKSQSKTSMGVVVGAILAGYIFVKYKASQRIFMTIALFVITTIIVMFLYIYKDPLSANFTDPRGFTGRIQIWTMLTNYASDNLLFGSGFGSFWNIGGNSPAMHLGKGWITNLASGHNGYLDLLVQVGIPGLALIVFAVVIWPAVRLLTSPLTSDARGAMAMALTFFCVGQNSTESSIFDRDVIVNVFLMLAIALITRLVETGERPEPARGKARIAPGSRDLREALR